MSSLVAKPVIENVGRKSTPGIFKGPNWKYKLLYVLGVDFHQQMVESTADFVR